MYIWSVKMVFCLLLLLYVALSVSVSAENSFVISEIMFNPNGDENAREFVEIYNLSSEKISLEGYIIGDGSGFDTLVAVYDDNRFINANSYALIMDPDYFSSDDPYENIPDDTPLFTVEDKALGSRGLSNSTAEPVYLVSPAGDTLSVVQYSIDCPAGHSWERVSMNGADTTDNFEPSKVENGTPGQPNFVMPPSLNPALEENSLSFYPEQPDMGQDIDIAVLYHNTGTETLSDITVSITMLPDLLLETVMFNDEVGPSEWSEETSIRVKNIPAGNLGFRATIDTDMNNGTTYDDTLHAQLNVPVSDGALILNEILADPGEGQSEWIEILNMANAAVDLYGFCVRDRSGSMSKPVANHILIEPGTMAVIAAVNPGNINPGSMFIQVGSFPALNNDGDSVTLIDYTGVVIDSMWYEDAPDGKSLELISPQLRGDISGWDICVDPEGSTPGSENSIYFSYVQEGDKPKTTSPQLHLDPNPFLHEITISYELPFPLARVRMFVYDRRGRKVTTLRDAEESGSIWNGTWDGRSGGRRVPAGPYILDFEIQDKQTGKMYRLRETVVVASQL